MKDDTLLPADVAGHAAFVRRLASRLLRDDADADDAAQQTLASALESPPRRATGARGWFTVVLRNVVRKGARTAVRRDRRERVAARREATPAVDALAARGEVLRRVTDAVRGLDRPSREVVFLRYYEDLPPREIALRLGVPVETVKSRLRRAHERLRARLDEDRGGNVEGWRSALAGLVGLGDSQGPMTTGAPVGGGIAVGTATKIGIGMAAAALVGVGAWGLRARERGEARIPEAARNAPGLAQAGPAGVPPTLAARPASPSSAGADHAAPPAVPAAVALAGVVVDAEGRGIEGCRVWTAARTGKGAMGPPSPEAVSDANGAFVLAGGPGETWGGVWLYARAPGRPLASAAVDALPRDDRGCVLTLRSGLALGGHVVGPDGAGLAGVRVQLRGRGAEDVGWASAPSAWNPGRVPEFAETLTDGQGRFRFDGLADAAYELVAAKSGYVQRFPRGSRPSVRPDGAEPPPVVLDPLYGIALQAVDDESGETIPGAEFAVAMPSGAPWISRAAPLDVAGPIPSAAETVAARAAQGARAEFVLATGGDPAAPVRIEGYAPGFASARVSVVPVPLAVVQPTFVRLKRTAPTVDVRIRCSWTKPPLPSGCFQLGFLDRRTSDMLQLTLIEGRSPTPLSLPVGNHPISLRGSGGSTLTWDGPFGTDGRGQPRDARLDVSAGDDGEVTLDLYGGGLIVAPRLEDGTPVSAFSLSCETGTSSFSIRTWEATPRLERLRVGEVEGYLFWMNPGPQSLVVGKPGYQAARDTLSIPSDGAVVTWEPVLTPSD